MNKQFVFDYRALRLLVGLIALALPFAVTILSKDNSLQSISASYHTAARDAFVGMLCIVGAFMWAYNGHSIKEGTASKIASLAAFMVALFPTRCSGCDLTHITYIHYISAAVLFAILAYFCLGPFRKNTKGAGGKKARRAKIYLFCGVTIIISMLAIGVSNYMGIDEQYRITYWGEAVALCAFGIAWIVAGKVIPWLVDDEEALRLLKQKS